MNTGNYKLVSTSKYADPNECFKVWEEIVAAQHASQKSNKVRIAVDTLKAHNRYVAEYIIVTSLLTKALFKYDKKVIAELAQYGYKIDVTNYAQSVHQAFNKLRNISSKIESKRIEIEELLGSDQEFKPLVLGEMLANVSAGLGFNISDTITLSQFNQYVLILKEKQKKDKNG